MHSSCSNTSCWGRIIETYLISAGSKNSGSSTMMKATRVSNMAIPLGHGAVEEGGRSFVGVREWKREPKSRASFYFLCSYEQRFRGLTAPRWWPRRLVDASPATELANLSQNFRQTHPHEHANPSLFKTASREEERDHPVEAAEIQRPFSRGRCFHY